MEGNCKNVHVYSKSSLFPAAVMELIPHFSDYWSLLRPCLIITLLQRQAPVIQMFASLSIMQAFYNN